MTLSWLLPRRLVTARVVIGRSFSAALSSSSSSSSATTTTTKTTSSTRLSYAESLPWATVDPLQLTGYDPNPYRIQNLCDGKWTGHEQQDRLDIPAPLDRNAPHALFSIPKTNETDELILFCQSLAKVPKSGLHNPLKDVHRYLEWGDIARKAGHVLSSPAGSDFFARCIQACVPKSYDQAMGEVRVTASFLNNFAGDNVRRLATSFGVPGDHVGQMSVGHRWPYGSVAVICPFNFPLEIPVLQVMGALFMGNKAVLKPSEPASIVMEQFLRLLHYCGMDPSDCDLLNCQGPVMEQLLVKAPIRMTQFTGSSRVGERLATVTRGKIKLEDAGFDWKILGPDVPTAEQPQTVNHVAWQCDQDAYACAGQKCSAQSILLVHENWKTTNFMERLEATAAHRSLADLTVGPTMTVTTETFLNHVQQVSSIPGAQVLFGGQELKQHTIPPQYGAVEPTAVYVPLQELVKPQHVDLCTTELFAPFQVISYYNDQTLPIVLDLMEGMSHHLTAAVVSNDVDFCQHVLAHTVNGTTYTGRRARTTGAPQNHWFGPAGDPRGAGIGTPEAIQLVWSCHREIITDHAPIPTDWIQPPPT